MDSIKRFARCCMLAGMFAGLAVGAGAQQDLETISNFRIPDYNDDMSLRSIIYGGSAAFKESTGFADIKDMKVEYYDGKEVEVLITAPQCTFDRKNKRAKSAGPIRISRSDMIVTGEDYGLDQVKENFLIKKNVKVVIKNLRKAESITGEEDDKEE